MTVTLGEFAQQQIDAQGLTVKEFARRAELGLSHAYQILRGERTRASADTFEAVARGLSMTPAQMLVLMGKGGISADTPDEVELLAAYRRVPTEQRPTVKQILRGLVAPTGHTPSNGRGDAQSKRLKSLRAKLEANQANEGNLPDQDTLGHHYPRSWAFLHAEPRLLAST